MNQPTETASETVERRQYWMGVLAKAPTGALQAAWDGLADKPGYRLLRAAETGMVMVRGRAGGDGDRFNLGEMTVTRCAVQVEGGATGYGYVAGRERRRAELAALFDALLQDEARRPALEAAVVAPLAETQAAARRAAAVKAASTRVEFFTMVRGED